MPKQPPPSTNELRVSKALAEAVLVVLLVAVIVFGAGWRAGVIG